MDFILKDIYDCGINVSIQSFWPVGWEVMIGDEANGWRAKANVSSINDIRIWLIEEVTLLWPESTFAKQSNMKRLLAHYKERNFQCPI